TSSVLSIDDDGILNACTMKLVPNSAKRTVTRSDSRYSGSVACARRRRAAFSATTVRSSICSLSVVPSSCTANSPPLLLAANRPPDRERCSPPAAPPLSSCCPARRPGARRRPTLPPQRSSGDRARSLPKGDIRLAAVRALAEAPAALICDPTPRSAHHPQ